MWDILFNNLPLTILIIVALFFCAIEVIKGVQFLKGLKDRQVDQEVEERQQEIDIQDEFKALHNRFDDIDKKLTDMELRMFTAEQRLHDLTQSDMHDIKCWIVDQYQKFYVEQGWIDAFHADTIDRRYEDYLKEGGNSYIETLIERLHTLPMDPPADKKGGDKK